MTDVLSQDEINELLAAVDAAYAGGQKNSGVSDIEDYPNKFSRDQLGEISIIHEKFARIVKKSFSVQLRSTINMDVASVCQLTMGDFCRCIPTPTTLGVFNMEPLKGSAVLEIDPLITNALIDRISGKAISTKTPHELTDSETIIMKGIFVSLLENLREAWSEIIDLQPRLIKIESDPKFIRLVPPAEGVVLVTLETKIENVEGMLNFCIPYPVIEPITEKLTL